MTKKLRPKTNPFVTILKISKEAPRRCDERMRMAHGIETKKVMTVHIKNTRVIKDEASPNSELSLSKASDAKRPASGDDTATNVVRMACNGDNCNMASSSSTVIFFNVDSSKAGSELKISRTVDKFLEDDSWAFSMRLAEEFEILVWMVEKSARLFWVWFSCE